MERKPRFSHQREVVLKIILQSEGHLPAEEIYEQVKKKVPSISLGTVYRNLALLENLKKISKIQGLNQIMYFEPYKAPHHHFICEECETIKNLDSPSVNICNTCVSDSSQTPPYKINNIAMTLYGLCELCYVKSEEGNLLKIISK